ncbi:MAG: hypothetical protein HY913_13450 [Desulfomonile tiedjei]|nr:hypothetical protein [Desulfomonile tiedjei]
MDTRKTKQSSHGLLAEYLYFLRTYKMWWLAPLFVLIAVLGVFVVTLGSKAALMIYALF